jgi:hypothetical protein
MNPLPVLTYLGADHSGPLSNPAQGLAKVAAATNERHLEVVLVDVMNLIRWSEHLVVLQDITAHS